MSYGKQRISDQSELLAYEYGTMSSKFRLLAENKLTAYATMCLHYNESNHLLVIYSPESSEADSWTSFDGKIAGRLDEISSSVSPAGR